MRDELKEKPTSHAPPSPLTFPSVTAAKDFCDGGTVTATNGSTYKMIEGSKVVRRGNRVTLTGPVQISWVMPFPKGGTK